MGKEDLGLITPAKAYENLVGLGLHEVWAEVIASQMQIVNEEILSCTDLADFVIENINWSGPNHDLDFSFWDTLHEELVFRKEQKLDAVQVSADYKTSFESLLVYPPGSIVMIDGSEHVITNADLASGCVQYATNRSAWHDHDEVTLISLPTRESLAIAIRACSMEDEYDEDEYDEDEEEDIPDESWTD